MTALLNVSIGPSSEYSWLTLVILGISASLALSALSKGATICRNRAASIAVVVIVVVVPEAPVVGSGNSRVVDGLEVLGTVVVDGAAVLVQAPPARASATRRASRLTHEGYARGVGRELAAAAGTGRSSPEGGGHGSAREWSATVPAGNYRAVGAPGCPRAEPQFMVSTGKTLKGVIVWTGCDYK